MDEGFKRKYGGVSTDSSSGKEEIDAPRTLHYQPMELKRIGEHCGNRLPPASAVQAMFLYEMQRESEVEKLFHHQMFRLARNEDTSANQDRRIDALEARIAQMEKQALSRDVEERLATSKVALNVQHGKLNICNTRVDGLEQKLADVVAQLDGLQKTACTEVAAQPETESLATVKEEIDVLFDDRDGILHMIDETKDRINKLEDNVRALTLQGTTIKSPCTNSPQVLPMAMSNGRTMDLAVPKGSAHVSLKENHGAIRSFSPGKQWGS